MSDPVPPSGDGPAAPQSDGPAAPQSDGPAAPQSDGPAAPQSDGPAAPQSDGPAAPQSDGLGAQQYAIPDAPRYAVPAYAAPEPGDSPAPGGGTTHPRYAAPSGYTIADPRLAATSASLPPYARAAAGTTPHAVVPGYRAAPGRPLPHATGAAAFTGAPDARPRTLAITALILAAAGVLLAFVPPLLGLFSTGWMSFLLLAAAFVLSLVAVISRNQGGKGFGIGALVTSIIGGGLSVALIAAWALGSYTSSYTDDAPGGWSDGYSDDSSGDDPGEPAVPGIAAPGTDGQPDPGVHFAPPVQPVVAETAFGEDYDDVWWYVVVVDNPNTDYVFDAYLEVRATTDDGSEVEPSTAFATLLAGRTAIVGYFFNAGDAQITGVEVDLPEASEATLAPGDETGGFTVADVTGTGDGSTPSVTGTVSARFAEDQKYVGITVLARAVDGRIVAAGTAYVEGVPADGTPVPFEAWFTDLPADVTFEASAHR